MRIEIEAQEAAGVWPCAFLSHSAMSKERSGLRVANGHGRTQTPFLPPYVYLSPSCDPRHAVHRTNKLNVGLTYTLN